VVDIMFLSAIGMKLFKHSAGEMLLAAPRRGSSILLYPIYAAGVTAFVNETGPRVRYDIGLSVDRWVDGSMDYGAHLIPIVSIEAAPKALITGLLTAFKP